MVASSDRKGFKNGITPCENRNSAFSEVLLGITRNVPQTSSSALSWPSQNQSLRNCRTFCLFPSMSYIYFTSDQSQGIDHVTPPKCFLCSPNPDLLWHSLGKLQAKGLSTGGSHPAILFRSPGGLLSPNQESPRTSFCHRRILRLDLQNNLEKRQMFSCRKRTVINVKHFSLMRPQFIFFFTRKYNPLNIIAP